jgi:hypothetical protein
MVSLFSADERVPFLSTDLRPFGYLPPVGERDIRYYNFLRGAVTFLDNQTLAVSFFKKNEHPGLSRRDGTPGSAVVFQTVFLDTSTGRVRDQRTWGNAANAAALQAFHDGSLLIQDGEWVRLYSNQLQETLKKNMDVPGDIPPRFTVSSSGRALYEFQEVYDAKRGWLTRIDVLDPPLARFEAIQSDTGAPRRHCFRYPSCLLACSGRRSSFAPLRLQAR